MSSDDAVDLTSEPEDPGGAEDPGEAIGGAEGSGKRPKKRWVRWVVIGIIAVVAIGIAVPSIFAASLVMRANNDLTVLPSNSVFPQESTRPTTVPDAPAQPLNILLVGSDKAGGIHSPADVYGNRSDTIMVVHVSADRKSVSVMSIMRDSWVPIEGHGDAKINAAISWGGVPLMVSTVESVIGARIDHVAIVDFEGFRALADALGGVKVYNPTAFTSRNQKGSRFPQGEITLKGNDALAYVRERYAFADGDYSRVRNQQAFLRGALSGVMDSMNDPARLQAITETVMKEITVDDGMDVGTVLDLGRSLATMPRENLRFFTAPTTGPAWRGSQSVILIDWEALGQVQDAFADDTVNKWAAEHQR